MDINFELSANEIEYPYIAVHVRLSVHTRYNYISWTEDCSSNLQIVKFPDCETYHL